MQGESSHACNRTLYSCRTACDVACSSRTHENAARGHTLPFRTVGDATAILSARGLVHKRWHASISQGSCICTSYTSVTYDMHMHICARAAHCTQCACRTAQNPCQKRASLMQHCMVAASRVDPIWPKLVFSATADCALHPYQVRIHHLRRPIPRTRKQGRVFARRRQKIWKLGIETVEC